MAIHTDSFIESNTDILRVNVPNVSDTPFLPIAEANRENLDAHYHTTRSEAHAPKYHERLNTFVEHVTTAKRVSINLGTQETKC